MKQVIFCLFVTLVISACHNTPGVENDSTALTEEEHVFQLDTVKGIVYGSFNYDSIVAFEIPFEHEVYSIVKDSSIKTGSYIKRLKLTGEKGIKVNNILNDTATYGTSPASCFEPHLVIAYFKENKVIAEAAICFRCNGLFSNPRIAASHYHQYLSIVENDTFQITRNGFSALGREQLGKFCNEFNFSHCNNE